MSGPLVAACLGALRGTADEIIVAADARVESSDLGHYADVADVLVRFEHVGANRHWPWLVEQAGGDWVMVIDGDEMPSAALISALPDLLADRRVSQYWLPVHWSWPTTDTRLDEEPWASNRGLRLMRNAPGLAFAARKHALVHSDPPLRFVDECPIYHLDLLIPDRARREAKVRRYDGELFGLLTPEGMPFNEAFYFPEARSAALRTARVPVDDALRIAAALGAEALRARRSRGTPCPCMTVPRSRGMRRIHTCQMPLTAGGSPQPGRCRGSLRSVMTTPSGSR